jgi:hypothetical protein
MNLQEDNNYYVYAYLRKDGTPYYIGKGSGNRAYSKNHSVYVPKDKRKIVFISTELSELWALALERRFIRWYGRKDLSSGILRNKTDGGEGVSGLSHSEETKQKISKANSGRSMKPVSEETKQKIREIRTGKTHSEETKQKMRKPKKPSSVETQRKPFSEETKQKMKEAKLGKTRKPFSEETKQKMRLAQQKRRSLELNLNK